MSQRNRIPKRVFMSGVGGIGMSALAQLLQVRGVKVEGADRDESPTTALLASKGIRVCLPAGQAGVGHDGCAIPADTELLIYSDAIPFDNAERVRAREMKMPEQSYFEALGEVSRDMRTLAVAGTHGKTTTTGMLAAILKAAGEEPTAIVGSIVRDFESNFLPGRDDLLVVEACEYRDHLLKLSPEILVITNIEHDHTDYFPTLAAIQKTFATAVAKVPAHGAIITNPHDPNIAPVLTSAKARVIDYTSADVPPLKLIGEFNRDNARAASSAARAAFPDIEQGTIDRVLTDFRGSWRRFEHKGETGNGASVYDDYAHHPTAIRKTIEAARERFPDKKIVVAFHPHLYSRTRDLMEDFASALATADEVVLAPIYAAREKPLDGVSSEVLAEAVCARGGVAQAYAGFDEIRTRLLQEKEKTLIITMGAGDIYKVAEQLVEE